MRQAPTAAHTSSTSRAWQIALEPSASRSGRLSSTTTGIPQRASSSAVVWPTGPLPITATASALLVVVIARLVVATVGRRSALQRFPNLAVALRGPDARPVDPVQLVPQPLHVERQAVLEDRPAPVGRRE